MSWQETSLVCRESARNFSGHSIVDESGFDPYPLPQRRALDRVYAGFLIRIAKVISSIPIAAPTTKTPLDSGVFLAVTLVHLLRQQFVDAIGLVDGVALRVVDADFPECLQNHGGFHVFGYGEQPQ